MIRTLSLVLAVAIGGSLAAGSAALAAGQISPEALAADRKACVSTCTGKGQTASKCDSYCGCTMQGIGDQLTPEEYRALSAAASSQQAAPQPTIAKLRTITDACRAETIP